MSVIAICISFQVAILAIAYPIMLQVITDLDNKYSSIFITGLFKEEIQWKRFSKSIVFTLISTLLYILSNISQLWFKTPSWISDLVFSLVIISTVCLLIFFYLFINKVLVYYTPSEIVNYLINKKDDDEHTNFKAVSDILYQAIRTEDERTAITISDYIYSEFDKYRMNNSNKVSNYPADYYQMVYKTVEELAVLGSDRFTFLESLALGGRWLYGEREGKPIHENTFSCQWRINLLAIQYDRDDMLMQFWSKSHQYLIFNLRSIYPEYNFSDTNLEPINSEEIMIRRRQQERFLEFCNAFGGLVLYRERYDLLKRMFSYTNSKPPKYELLPDTMNEVFNIYFNFRDPYNQNHRWITHKYDFPQTDGMNAEGAVKNWICRYAALLFLRQYMIRPYLYTQRPLELPNIPETQRERKLWRNNIEHFKILVLEIRSNEELMNTLGLDFISIDWCEENNYLDPESFFDKLINIIDESIEHAEIHQELSQVKVQKFKDSTVKILSESIEEIDKVFNKNEIVENYNSWFTRDITSVSDKNAFADDQEADHLNYDSFLASEQTILINQIISETFDLNKSASYLIKQEVFEEATKKIIGKSKEVVFVNLGINLTYYGGAIRGLSKDKFYDHEIIDFKKYNNPVVRRSMYLLKKEDLPSLKFLKIDEDVQDKYDLKLLDDDLKIYANVIDLNKNKELREELEQNRKDLSKSVFRYIGTNYEIRWKKKIKMCELKIFSEYVEKGIPNSIKDITFKLSQ